MEGHLSVRVGGEVTRLCMAMQREPRSAEGSV